MDEADRNLVSSSAAEDVERHYQGMEEPPAAAAAPPRPRGRGPVAQAADVGVFDPRRAEQLPVAEVEGGGGFSAQFGSFAHRPEEPLPVSLDEIQAYRAEIRRIVSNKHLSDRQRELALQTAFNKYSLLAGAVDEFVSENIDPRKSQIILNAGDRMAHQIQEEIDDLERDQYNAEVVPVAVMARPGNEFSQEAILVFQAACNTLRFYQSLNVVPYSTLSVEEKNLMNEFIMENLIEALRVRLLAQVRRNGPKPDGEVNKQFVYFMRVHLRTILKSAPEVLSQFFGVDGQGHLRIPQEQEVKLLICNAVIDDVIEKTRGIADSLLMIAMSSTSQQRWRFGAGLLGILAAESNYTLIGSLLSHTKTGVMLLLEAAMFSFTNWPAATLSGGAFIAVEHESIYDLWLMLRLELGMAPLPYADAQHDDMFKHLLRSCSREIESGRVQGILGPPPVINGPLDFIGAGKYVLYRTAGAVCTSLTGAGNMVRGVSRIPERFSRFCGDVVDSVGSFLQHQSHQNDDMSRDAVLLMAHECRENFEKLVAAGGQFSPEAMAEIEVVLGNLGMFDEHVVLTEARVKAHEAHSLLIHGVDLRDPSLTEMAEGGNTEASQELRRSVMDQRTPSRYILEFDGAGNAFTRENPLVVGTDAPRGERDAWRWAFKPRFPHNVDAAPFPPPPSNRNVVAQVAKSTGAKSTRPRTKKKSNAKIGAKSSKREDGGGGNQGGGKRVTRRKALTKKNKTKKNKRQSRRKARRSYSCKSHK